jgi:hypothetical protein
VDSGILDAAQDVIGNDVPRDANNEKVPEPLVEDQLDRDARVAATKNDCKRMLAGDELVPQAGALVSVP